jgi:hypothetical protein
MEESTQKVHPLLGAIPDIQDARDIPMAAIMEDVALPDFVDYERFMPEVRDQHQRGACVAFATCAVKEFQEAMQRSTMRSQYPAFDFSEEWVYRQIRMPGGGAYMRDGFKVLSKMGVPREKFMPYDQSITDDSQEKPFTATNVATNNAKYYKAKGYARLTSIPEMKKSLHINGPFILGINWQNEWFNPAEKDEAGYPILNENANSPVGGHAICIVGYDSINNRFKMRNSWGNSWGKNGYAWVPFATALKFMHDAWSSFDIENPRINTEKVEEIKDVITTLPTTFRGSPNFWANRIYNGKQYKIDKIVIHWFGIGTLESADTRFMNAANQSSSSYGVSKGRIWQWVQEKDAPWANGDANANLTSVTIETDAIVSGQSNAHDLSELDYQTVGALVRDIAQRNGIPLDRAHIRRHSEFKPTQCCGTVDVDKIIAIAKGGSPAPINTGYPKEVTITIQGLKVRDAANTGGNLAGSQSLDEGDVVKVQNVVKGQYVEYPGIKGTDMWYVSMYGNFFWSGGTDEPVYPAPPAPTPPAPTPPAPIPTPPAPSNLYKVLDPSGKQIGAFQNNPIDRINGLVDTNGKLEQTVKDRDETIRQRDERIRQLEQQPSGPTLSDGEKSTLDGLKKLIKEQ